MSSDEDLVRRLRNPQTRQEAWNEFVEERLLSAMGEAIAKVKEINQEERDWYLSRILLTYNKRLIEGRLLAGWQQTSKGFRLDKFLTGIGFRRELRKWKWTSEKRAASRYAVKDHDDNKEISGKRMPDVICTPWDRFLGLRGTLHWHPGSGLSMPERYTALQLWPLFDRSLGAFKKLANTLRRKVSRQAIHKAVKRHGMRPRSRFETNLDALHVAADCEICHMEALAIDRIVNGKARPGSTRSMKPSQLATRRACVPLDSVAMCILLEVSADYLYVVKTRAMSLPIYREVLSEARHVPSSEPAQIEDDEGDDDEG